MPGKTIMIPDEHGKKVTVDLLCTYTFAGDLYYIAQDGDGSAFGQLEWGLFKGTHRSGAPVSPDARAAGEELLRQAQACPARLTLDGGHYRVKSAPDAAGWEFLPDGKVPELYSPFMKWFPLTVCFAAAMLPAAVFAFLYCETFGMMWGSAVFPDLSRAVLKILMYGIELGGAAVIFAIRDENRGLLELCLNALIPLDLLTAIGLARVNPIARAILICLVVLYAAYGGWRLWRISRDKPLPKIGGNTVRRALCRLYTPVLTVVLCCLFAVRICGITGYTLRAVPTPGDDTATITARYEAALPDLREDVFAGLTVQQRLDTLQRVCDYECAVTLGCRTVAVQAGYPDNEAIFGQYNPVGDTVLINAEYLREASVHDLLNTVLHETRHIYQYAVVDMFNAVEKVLNEESMRLPIFRYAAQMRDNLEQYRRVGTDYGAYYGQAAEADSRSWAAQVMAERYDARIRGEAPEAG